MGRPSLPASIRHLVPVVERAAQAWSAGERKIAELLCIEVLELAPDLHGALSLLGEIRRADGNQAATRTLIRRIVALDANNFAATNELALLALNAGDLAEAEHHARNAVRIAPDRAQAHSLMGMVMTELHRSAVGEYHYRRALALGPRHPVLLANLAWNLKTQGRVDAARALYEESVAAAPDVPQTLLGWARLEEADRKLDAALDKLDRLDAIAPALPAARLARAAVLGRQNRQAEALALLGDTAGDVGLGPLEALEKGRLLDQLGRYDDAWAAFAHGKARERERGGNAYPADQAETLARRLRGFFKAERLAALPRAGIRTDVPQPVFILGFPRSGTTLLEQTLSATPAICAGDELPLIHEITQSMPRRLNSPLSYPEALADLWMGDQHDGLDNLRDHYLQKVREMGVLRDGARYFTDKMPLNETHMGLIALLFPQAPLLHMVRHPLDVMVSAMSNHFTHGLHCGAALESAARHLVLVSDLVEHYPRADGAALPACPLRGHGRRSGTRASGGVFDFIGEPNSTRRPCISSATPATPEQRATPR